MIKRCYKKFRLILRFFHHLKRYLGQNSYYPEEKRKSFWRMIWDFSAYIIKYGQIPKEYFMYGLDRVAADWDDYMMPYSSFMELRKRKNTVHVGVQTPYSYVCLLRDKELFEWVSEKYEIPTPKVIGTLRDGVLSGKETVCFIDYCSSMSENSALFLKEIAGYKGSGAFAIEKMGGKYYLNGERLGLNEILSRVPSQQAYLIQEKVVQHSAISQIYQNALNTMRVVSVIDGRDVVILGAFLRIGANGSVVDNWSIGGLAVGVNEDGTLMKWGFYRSDFGTKTDRHPNSGVIFEGYRLPYWEDAINLVKSCHSKLSFIGVIGWDIAFTENGPIIIEGNDDFGGTSLQTCTGGKKKEFLRYLR